MLVDLQIKIMLYFDLKVKVSNMADTPLSKVVYFYNIMPIDLNLEFIMTSLIPALSCRKEM